MDTKSNKWWTEIDNFDKLFSEENDEKFTTKELWKIYSLVNAQKMIFIKGTTPYIHVKFSEYNYVTITDLTEENDYQHYGDDRYNCTWNIEGIKPEVFDQIEETNLIDIELQKKNIGIIILKYPEDWYYVNYYYWDMFRQETNFYYRCDGFLGLQKLLEHLDLNK